MIERASDHLDVSRKDFSPWLSLASSIKDWPHAPGLLEASVRGQGGLFRSDPHYLALVQDMIDWCAERDEAPIDVFGSFRAQRPHEPSLRVFNDVTEKSPWCEEFIEESLETIRQASGELGELADALLREIIPIRRNDITGLSTAYAPGAVFVALYDGVPLYDFTLYLVHEFGHQALMGLEAATREYPIFDASGQDPTWTPMDDSAWSEAREENRPLPLSLHSASAKAYELIFARACHERRLFPELADKLRGDILELEQGLLMNLASLFERAKYTKLGSQLLRELTSVATLT